MHLPEWLLLLSALLTAAVLLGLLARRIRLPFTVVLAVVGFLAAALGEPLGWESPLQGEAFEEVVVFAFLPALVFAAALGFSVRAFLRNLGPILVLAIVAFAISAVLVGLVLHATLTIPLTPALLFGALISATDPVAVVAVFRRLGVPERLLVLVEGESLLNDGVAIVLFTILLAAAQGGGASVRGGMLDFGGVFLGGAAIGALLGGGTALVLPRLDRLAAAALSVAVAYGGFVLADEVLGFSGVMATVAAGLVLGGLAPSRAPAPTRALWQELWEAVDYIANALLFLLIGLAIDPTLIRENLGAIAIAVVVALIARTLAVVPLVSALERFAHIPPVGRRNEAVLIWGGLRGGVALALALALPEAFAERERFIAMTGGVVLATLLVNATTIGTLVHRLGLDVPGREEQFLAGVARLAAVEAARRRLQELGLADPLVAAELDTLERVARAGLERIELRDVEQHRVAIRRGLVVQRETYQRLHDAGLLPDTVTLVVLQEVDDQIEELALEHGAPAALRRRPEPRVARLVQRLSAWLPRPVGEDPTELAYAEASARQLAARRAGEALAVFARLPGIAAAAVRDATERFACWEQEARVSLTDLDERVGADRVGLRRWQAESLSRVAADDALQALSDAGLLPETITRRAAEVVAAGLSEAV